MVLRLVVAGVELARWTAGNLKTVEKRLPQRPSAARTAPPVDSTARVDVLGSPASAGKPKRSKYGAVKTNGYASAKEARRAAELKLLEKAGTIRNLREQVEFELIPVQRRAAHVIAKRAAMERAVKYVADFEYEELRETTGWWYDVVEDCKGMRTPDYIIKRKLMLFIHGIAIRET